MSSDQVTVYTIGHGRHPFDYFLDLLKRHKIAFVCDVRSSPRSRWPQYNRGTLAEALRQNGIGYEHLPECGGKVIAPPDELARGLDRIVELASEMRVAVMCSESQPVTAHTSAPRANCHRVGMLATPLRARGADIIHILPDGETLVCDEAQLSSVW
ncbi:MAG TPA: DUF488 domain-containing protein [Blastocatellia bacterium]|nr:DUF488 domain-containing protein [Blastocatellia bacterium]